MLRLELEFIALERMRRQHVTSPHIFNFSMLSKGLNFLSFQNPCTHTLCVVFLRVFSRICIAGFLVDFRILAIFSIGLCRHFVALRSCWGFFALFLSIGWIFKASQNYQAFSSISVHAKSFFIKFVQVHF